VGARDLLSNLTELDAGEDVEVGSGLHLGEEVVDGDRGHVHLHAHELRGREAAAHDERRMRLPQRVELGQAEEAQVEPLQPLQQLPRFIQIRLVAHDLGAPACAHGILQQAPRLIDVACDLGREGVFGAVDAPDRGLELAEVARDIR
jgi:hypothetical protein